MKKIDIYTTNYCPFCIKAKSLLIKKKIKFSEIDVSNDEILRENKKQELIKETTGSTNYIKILLPVIL